MLLLCLCSGVTQLCLKTFVRRPWSCRLNALAQCVYVKGPDVKGQLSATRRRSSQLPDSRTSILRLTVSQTSLSSSSTNGTESDTKLPGFLKFLTSCRNLLSLGLQIPAINDDDLWILSKQCPSLQRLTIVSVPHLSWARISDEGLAAVCKQAKDLRHIHVKVQQEQQRAGPLDGERRMRNAQDDESASGWVISERSLLNIAETYKGRLTGFGFQLTMVSGSPGPGNVQGLVQNVQQMASGISLIIKNNPQLEFLCLDWPVNTDSMLKTASENLRSLKSLWIGSMFKTFELTRLIRNNNRLASLRIWELPLNEETAKELFASLSHQHSGHVVEGDVLSRNLRVLELDGLGYLPHLIPPPMAFPNLKKLKILPSRSAASLHSNFTDHLVSALVRASPCLESLTVPILTDEPLLELANSCQSLTELDVVDGRDLTESALVLLVKCCSQLSHLALGSASRLTDNTIQTLARTCGPRLTRLSLPFGNAQLTKLSFLTLCHECPALEALTNVPIGKVSFEDLSYAIPKSPRLYILGLSGHGPTALGLYSGDLDRPKIEQLKKSSKRLKQVIFNY